MGAQDRYPRALNALGRRNAQFLAMRLRPARQSRYAQMGGPDVTRDRSGRTCTHMHMYMYMYMYMHTHMHVCMYVCVVILSRSYLTYTRSPAALCPLVLAKA